MKKRTILSIGSIMAVILLMSMSAIPAVTARATLNHEASEPKHLHTTEEHNDEKELNHGRFRILEKLRILLSILCIKADTWITQRLEILFDILGVISYSIFFAFLVILEILGLYKIPVKPY